MDQFNYLVKKCLILNGSLEDFEKGLIEPTLIEYDNYLTSVEVLDNLSIFRRAFEFLKAEQSGRVKSSKTWSQQLLEDIPGSKWITYRGNRILIRGNPDGTASVVFSANPAFEHLKIIPKTTEQYAEIKKKIEERKNKRKDEEEAMTDEDFQKISNQQKIAREERNRLKKEADEKIMEILGLGKVVEEDTGISGLKKAEKKKIGEKVNDVLEQMNRNDEKTDFTDLSDLLEKEKENLSEKEYNELEKATKEALIEKSEEVIVNEFLEGSSGEGVIDKPKISKTGNSDIDKAIEKMQISLDKAVEIAAIQQQLKEKTKQINKEVKVAKTNVEFTSLQGIGIVDFNNEPEEVNAVVDKVLEKIENINRAKENARFYDVIDEDLNKGKDRTKAQLKYSREGGTLALNAVSMMIDNSGLSNELVEFLGFKNSARIIANRIKQRDDADELEKNLEQFVVLNSKKVVSESLEVARKGFDNIMSYTEQAKDEILAYQTANARKAQQIGQIGKKVSLASGSLEACATLLDVLRDEKDDISADVVISADEETILRDNLKRIGLKQDSFSMKRSKNGGFEVNIPISNLDKILKKSNSDFKRNEKIKEIKNLEKATGLRAKGQPDKHFEFFNKDQFESEVPKSEQGEFEKYKNKKGEDGYTSSYPEGTELYRRERDAFSMGLGQEKAFRMIMENKRVLADLGAGIGKTFLFLSSVSELKTTGKLEGSFAFISPPSRLVNEFLKDQEKHFPNLRVLVLDKIRDDKNGTTRENRLRALQEASEGKYDLVLSGHDTIKGGVDASSIKEYVASKEESFMNALRENGNKVSQKDMVEMRKKWTVEARQGANLASEVAKFKPSFVGVDEAHEAFKEIKFDKKGKPITSGRFEAMKKLSDSAEYFVPATGTPVRNTIGEMISLAHITRPDLIQEPEKLAKRYENLGQGTTMFQEHAVNEFRKLFDDVLISERTKLDVKKHEKENKVKLTTEQKQMYKKAEAQYRFDRDNDGLYTVRNKKTGFFHEKKENDFTVFDNVPFSIGSGSGDDADVAEGEEAPSRIGFQSEAEKTWLKSKGFDHNDYEVVQLGLKKGATMRRDSIHNRTLNAGDHKTNAKAINITNAIKNDASAKHIIHYELKGSLDMMKNSLLENGFTENQIRFIDGSLSKEQRNKAKTEFQEDPEVKVILLSNAGATGFNLQKGDIQHHIGRKNTYALQEQANARSYRTGRKGDVEVNYYDTDTVFDHARVASVEKKKKTTSLVGNYQDEISIKSEVEKFANKAMDNFIIESLQKSHFIQSNGTTFFSQDLITKMVIENNFDFTKLNRSKIKNQYVYYK